MSAQVVVLTIRVQCCDHSAVQCDAYGPAAGIDPAGKNYWIHHCSVVNDDDSVAVKPTHGGGGGGVAGPLDCSADMLIEDVVLTGVSWDTYPPYNTPTTSLPRQPSNWPKTLGEASSKCITTGVGASIGSVPPHIGHNCVRNITFRQANLDMFCLPTTLTYSL